MNSDSKQAGNRNKKAKKVKHTTITAIIVFAQCLLVTETDIGSAL
jgi:hypothetical protein